MPAKAHNGDELREAYALVEHHGSIAGAARAENLARSTLESRYGRALAVLGLPDVRSDKVTLSGRIPMAATLPPPKEFERDELPDELPTAEELLERRTKQFAKKAAAESARQLIPIRIKTKGPIGIMHMGDPHIDDNGTDISLLRSHVDLVNKTDALFCANVGDLHNNWVGRLARLYGQQSTSAAEAWVLVEWLFKAVRWLYVVGGNHDVWSGPGDPSKWLAKFHGTLYEWHGARVGLQFPNGREIRINARHDFPGRSQFNPAHGPGKAVRFGWRDHIATCGHTHTSGLQILKDPMTGLISYAIRVGSYKAYDDHAKAMGFFDETAFVAPVTVIDPSKADNDPGCVTFFADPFVAADFLTWWRARKSAA